MLTRKLSSFTSVLRMNTRQLYFCYFKLLFLCLLVIFFVLLLLLLLPRNEFSLFFLSDEIELYILLFFSKILFLNVKNDSPSCQKKKLLSILLCERG